MIKIHFIFFLFFFWGSVVLGQDTHFVPKIDHVWQIGSCNCYLFNFSVWENTTNKDKFSSREIHSFHLITGEECKEFKDSGNLWSKDEIPQSLKELNLNHPFKLTKATPEELQKNPSFNDYQLLYTYPQSYDYLSLTLEKWKSAKNDGRRIFSLKVNGFETLNTENNKIISDLVVFGIYESLEDNKQ
jgi:hypothetical protein